MVHRYRHRQWVMEKSADLTQVNTYCLDCQSCTFYIYIYIYFWMVYFRLIEKSQSGIIWNLTKLGKSIRMNRIVHDTDKITCPSKSPRCFDVNLANVKATARLCRIFIFVAILENLIFLKSTLQHWPSREWAKRGAWPWDNITAASTNIGCCAKIECSPSTKHGMSQLGGIEFKLKSDTVATHLTANP